MKQIKWKVFVALIFCQSVLYAEMKIPMQAIPVADNVYAIITPSRELPNPQNLGWNSNSAFVVTNAGVILFDTGSSVPIGKAIKNSIAEVTDAPVRWIINSHAHGDHWLGNAAFKDTVEHIYASKPVVDKIKADGVSWVDRFNRMTDGATGESSILPPNTTVEERMELSAGNKKVMLFLSSDSHSPGDILLWLPDEKVLISGDVVYSDRMPSTHDSNLTNWIHLLGALEEMRPKVVIPGHGRVTDVNGIIQLKNLLQTFWSAVEKGYEENQTDYEMVTDVINEMAEYEPLYPGLAEKVKRDISSVYLQIEAANF